MSRARIVVVGAAAVDVKAQSFGTLVGRNMAKDFSLLGAISVLIARGDNDSRV